MDNYTEFMHIVNPPGKKIKIFYNFIRVEDSFENNCPMCYYKIIDLAMELEYIYWQDGNFFVGFLNKYPEDSTQGLSLAELEEALIEVYEIRQEGTRHLAQ